MTTRSNRASALLLLSASALLAAGCESTIPVGSECEDGVCPSASSVTQETCLVSSFRATIEVVNDDENPSAPWADYLCIGRGLSLDPTGKVACELRWSLGDGSESPPSGAPKRCSDAPFLTPAEAGVDDVCVVDQLTADQVGGGDDGWWYDDSIEDCLGDGNAGLRITAGAMPPTGTTVELRCARAQTTDDGEVVDIDVNQCERADSETLDLGAACLPEAIPESGFDPRVASVEMRSDQCQSEVCLVYALEGDPRPECEASEDHLCPTPAEIERAIYCSCRCDAPEGDPGPLCDCTDGFTCTPTLDDAPPGIRGSYCVNDQQLSAP
jgi:hypothetical protein